MKGKLAVAGMLVAFHAFALSPQPPASSPRPPASATMKNILEARELRVCTPGDYRPFSFMKSPDVYDGIDVDLMTSLALKHESKDADTAEARLVPKQNQESVTQ
ncbi:Bacterial extracellular solute-binding proteins, family 3 [Cupriavidus sp. YR651]|nr:Bacterial extracellular solute-binding proteins, family 3 [Cupriavidus sp. YR651]